jgi:hypothetical protein
VFWAGKYGVLGSIIALASDAIAHMLSLYCYRSTAVAHMLSLHCYRSTAIALLLHQLLGIGWDVSCATGGNHGVSIGTGPAVHLP